MGVRPLAALLLVIWFCLAGATSVDPCEAKLGSGRYYGAFVKALAMGAVGEEQLAHAVASEEPYFPLRDIAPAPNQVAAKRLFGELIDASDVREAWPRTREQLHRLYELRRTGKAVQEEAAEATRRVLAPQSQLEFKSRYSDTPVTRLDDGTFAIAHFVGQDRFAVTRLSDGVELVKPQELPPEHANANDANLAFFRDASGKLWLYLGLMSIEHGSNLYKLSWDERATNRWLPVDLGLGSRIQLRGLHAGIPGVLMAKVLIGSRGVQYFDISEGSALPLDGLTGYRPGDYVRTASGDYLTPHKIQTGISKIYDSRLGPLSFWSTDRAFHVAWKGQLHSIQVPASVWAGDAIDFGEFANGEAYFALLHHSPSLKYTVSIWRFGEFDAPIYSVEVPGSHFHSFRFFPDRDGKPLFAMNATDARIPHLVVLDPSAKSIRLSMALPDGGIVQWFEAEGATYFTSRTIGSGVSVHKLFNATAGSRGPSSISASGSCEFRLGSGRYYGAFVTSLAMGALTDEQLAKAVASDSPYHPLLTITPAPNQIAAKTLFTELVANPQVRAEWPRTREQLARLLEIRRLGQAVSQEASKATQRALVHREIMKYRSGYVGVSGTTLDDGRQVVAHFDTNKRITVTQLPDVSPLQSYDLPPERENASQAHITWYRDNNGKLYLYLVLVQGDTLSLAFRVEWGTRDWKRVPLELPAASYVEAIRSPAQGTLMLKVNVDGKTKVFDIASGSLKPIPKIASLEHGDFARLQDGTVASPYRRYHGEINKVFAGRDGLITVDSDQSKLWITWRDQRYSPKLFLPDFNAIAAAYFELANGREFLAVIHRRNGSENNVVNIWEMGSFDNPIYTDTFKALSIQGLQWISDPNGIPLLALNPYVVGNSRLLIYDPLATSVRLDQTIPGILDSWIVLGDDVYSVANEVNHWRIFKVFDVTRPQRGPSSENEGATNPCEARLGSGRYYGGFLKALTLGALTDEHLEKSVASERPYHPLRDVTPTPVQTGAKHLFDQLVDDQEVINQWPETRRALARLLELRRTGKVIEQNAAHATRRVFSPHVYFAFNTNSGAAATTTLDDQTPVLAHIEGEKFIVTRLRDKTDILTENLPSIASGTVIQMLSWYRDREGKLWLYFAGTHPGEGGVEVAKLAWGSSKWETLDLKLSKTTQARMLVSPSPGVLLLSTVRQGWSVVNIASGKAVHVEGLHILKPGRFAWISEDNILFDPTWDGDRTRVYNSKHGAVQFIVNPKKFEAEWRGNKYQIDLPNRGSDDQLSYREFNDGRELVALAHHVPILPQRATTVDVWRMGNFDRPMVSLNVQADLIDELTFIESTRAEPSLAVEASSGGHRLMFFDLRRQELHMNLPLPGAVHEWIEIDGETYFTVRTQTQLLVYQLFAETRGE